MSEIDVVEASIGDLQDALKSGSVTSVELVALYLGRISTYDCRGISLNSVPLLNLKVFDEAAASDDWRAAGLPVRPLEGIPYTVKNSYKVRGLTVASGSLAFKDLLSNDDSFVVEKLREAGAVLLGQTNTPPMMYGGMQRGLYGRAESPYNLDYLTAAFASGSSNGSATSTSASLAAFGIGSETVSSGRAPASNNALIAYTPSRSLISPRGVWPLYPTCDVVVPHARTMKDMFDILNVITAHDRNMDGDLWRQQPHIRLPDALTVFPKRFHDLGVEITLKGKRIAVPQMYIGDPISDGQPVIIRQSVIDLWVNAKADLEALGATVVTTDFPLVTNYEQETFPGQRVNIPDAPPDWNSTERGAMIAHAWNDFLISNKSPRLSSLASVDTTQIWPDWDPKSVQVRYSEPSNAIRWADLSNYIKANPTQSILGLPGLEQALRALEAARKRDLEDWLDAQQLDFVVFPANGDVGRADADVNDESSKHAWMNGVKYSNGNRAIRHLGVPTVSVPMGIMQDTGMPVNLTFAGKAYEDSKLLSYACAYEQASRKRRAPGLTPPLKSDLTSRTSSLPSGPPGRPRQDHRPDLKVLGARIERVGPVGNEADPAMLRVEVHGTVVTSGGADNEKGGLEYLSIHVNGTAVEVSKTSFKSGAGFWIWTWSCSTQTPAPIIRNERERTDAKVARDQTMVVVLAKKVNGGATGWLGMG